MSPPGAPLLLSPKQVKELSSNNTPVSILDATWFMPNIPRKPRDEFMAERIPGAQFLDIDKVASTHELGLMHMMPSGAVFAQACESLGVSKDTHVVLYDTHGVFSSPRALFMFRAFGHGNSSVLDGGLPRWKDEGYSVERHAAAQPRKVATYSTPDIISDVVREYAQMVSNCSLDPKTDPTASIVLDARPKARYLGIAPEPRPGLSSGHMPHSYSLAFNTFLQIRTSSDSSQYTVFRSPSDIRAALVEAVGVEEAEKIIAGARSVTTSCGSGMTAGVLWLGLKLLGVGKVSLYDESWTGYADPSRSSKINKSHAETG